MKNYSFLSQQTHQTFHDKKKSIGRRDRETEKETEWCMET